MSVIAIDCRKDHSLSFDAPRRIRVLYAAGPGDVIGSYSEWASGKHDITNMSPTYSEQFFDLCQELDVQAYVLARCSRRCPPVREGRFRIVHRPKPFKTASGILYHVGQVWWGLRLAVSALRFRADVAVVSEGNTHWFLVLLLAGMGIRVVPSIHCVLWTKQSRRSRVQRMLNRASGLLFMRSSAIIAASQVIADQITELGGGGELPVGVYLPYFTPEIFAGIREPNESHVPFRVLYIGRVKESKGVFDLLSIAERFQRLGRFEIEFDVCGDGSALPTLRSRADQAGLSHRFRCHGHCKRPALRELMADAHVVVVPTRSTVGEGFNHVVVEAVLAGRPVVTSSVCPALAYVSEAVVEVRPDDVEGYGNALLVLCDNHDIYEHKRQSCGLCAERFYDRQRTWGAMLKTILTCIKEDRDVKIISWTPERVRACAAHRA